MNNAQAYSILGVSPNCSMAEIDKAYLKKFNELRLQTLYGNPITVRNIAQQNMAQLKDAYEYLKKHHVQIPMRPAAVPQSFTMPNPVAPLPQHINNAARVPRPNPRGALPLSNGHMAASFIIAGIMMLAVIFFSLNASGFFNRKASLRVFSVPWCYVEVDGKKLGESGQSDAFEVSEGIHQLKLWVNNRVLTRKIELTKGSNVVVKAQFDKGIIDVDE